MRLVQNRSAASPRHRATHRRRETWRAGLLAPTAQFRPLYDQAALAFPDAYKAYTFERWLDFLSRQELIEVKSDQALITLNGRSLLMYLAHEGKSFERAG